MKIIRAVNFALGAFVFAASCSKEAAEQDVYDWTEGDIYFRPYISEVVGSRGQDMTLERLETFRVTCFNTAGPTAGSDGIVSTYFNDISFVRQGNNPELATYGTAPGETSYDWPSLDAILRFFAFSPSRDDMAYGIVQPDNNRDDERYFKLVNASTVGSDGSLSVNYRLENFRVNRDISRQIDFITAEAKGSRRNFSGGVELAFQHRLCQVELRAWGASEQYDFEIAGVRIGNPVVEGTFVFADDSKRDVSGKWAQAVNPRKDRVNYVYASADTIFRIAPGAHNTLNGAASIMGQGGCAMVLPTKNNKWEGLADPNIGESNYKTDRMYFSILLRVTDRATGNVVYPYPGNPKGLTVVSLTKGGETMDFGWAAVPVDADWSAGKKYIYTLDYTQGIGLHDPADPEPGTPIRGQSDISWGVVVDEWDYAEADDDNFTPDLDAP